MKHAARRTVWQVVILVLCIITLCFFAGCGESHSTNSKKSVSSGQANQGLSKTQVYGYDGQQRKATPIKPTYEDPRWPTRNQNLLDIPESNRWYNAWASAGTNCTIAGPVVNVHQAKESDGMPIFVDIGAAYPNNDRVTLIVWADQYDEFAEMINAVDDGGAWLSVSGYLDVYNDHLQFNAGDGYIEYTWWTHVS